MRGGVTWYRRFADIPGVRYAGDDVLRSRLPERDAVPRVTRDSYGGHREPTLWWTTAVGEGSRSPASALVFSLEHHKANGAQIRQHLLAALELPGTPEDYHFGLQSSLDRLWSLRKKEPDYPLIEWVCWMNIQLLQAHQEVVIERDGKGGTFHLNVLAFDHLVELYVREGFLHDALHVAHQVAPLSSPEDATVSELTALLQRRP